MTENNPETLPDEAILALAHTGDVRRAALRMYFELDMRLARIVSATTEPMLGQMRLAWWRDMLGTPPDEWPKGDWVLDGIARQWKGRETSLVPLVNAWEHLLAEPPLASEHAIQFAHGRRDSLLAVFDIDKADPGFTAFSDAAFHWAIADLASKVSLDEERGLLVDITRDRPRAKDRLPKDARGLAVLGALGWRALKRGGRPLMEGRGAALVAARAAITGR